MRLKSIYCSRGDSISNDKDSPISLRKRVIEAEKQLKHTEYYVPTQTHYDVLAEKEQELKSKLEGINAEITQNEIEWAKNGSLIEQMRCQPIVKNYLQCLKTMAVYDAMTDGQSTMALSLIDHMRTKGITKPTANGPCESHVVLDGLLDNLDEVKARIKAEFEKGLDDSDL